MLRSPWSNNNHGNFSLFVRFSFVFRSFFAIFAFVAAGAGAARLVTARLGFGPPPRRTQKLKMRGRKVSERPGVRTHGSPSVRASERPDVRASERLSVRKSKLVEVFSCRRLFRPAIMLVLHIAVVQCLIMGAYSVKMICIFLVFSVI